MKSQTIKNRDSIIESAVNDISVDNMKALIQDLVGFHNRNNLSSMTHPTQGIGATAEYLYQKVNTYIPSSNERLSVEKAFYTIGGPGTRLGREVTVCNVIATIQGSNPDDDRKIALLAHFDNRNGNGSDSIRYAPGANDDGSGVACLMEITRLLSRIDLPVTLKIMFLSGEEHGLYGAQYMANKAKQENWNLIAVLNNDMIGNGNASETNTHNNTMLRVFSENIPAIETDEMKRIRVYNSAENDSPSRQLARYIKETGERYVDNTTIKLIYRNDRFGRGGDHTPFSRKGYAAVRICEMHENYDRTHQYVREENGIRYGDEIEGIDFEYLRKNTGINLSSVANLALAPSVPENVRQEVSKLTNYSALRWDSPKQGKKPACYYVLIRETDQSQWQTKIRVEGTEARIPYSKDNYFYAVQSVDAEGHESLAVFATGGD
ncbi:M20/M25/M40 family metallo-hydrolase [Bacteroides sp. UBA939]|uniref:M20/M25/M40 family metallo-hydrolase n=1 Tax=Bacteroides sp. UBA939 TaxID=1946092 RepID=UPI0025B887BD|nr:M20/M25/M40 family metallo-hydrolase [Bacteroides sp. UBA939]